MQPEAQPSATPRDVDVQLVCALAAEAEPLTDHFGLAPIAPQKPFRVYESTDDADESKTRIRCVISGVGRIASATACGYVGGWSAAPMAWLNVGIGGHRDHAIGTPTIAKKIIGMKRCFYPQVVFADAAIDGLRTATIETVDAPETHYANDHVYDMEAAAFCEAALRFDTVEFVHALKVVSDNREHSPSRDRLDRAAVSRTIAQHIEAIERMCHALAALVREQRALAAFDPDTEAALREVRDRFHFTVTLDRQLTGAVRRHRLLSSAPLPIDELLAQADARGVVARLDGAVAALRLRLTRAPQS